MLSRITFTLVVWAGCAPYLTDKLEGIQRRFVYMLHGRFFNHIPYNYNAVLREIGLLTVRNNLVYRDTLFMYSVIRGRVYARQLLSSINFRVPLRTRLVNMFYKPNDVNIISQLCSQFNPLNILLDIFALSWKAFKKKLYDILK